MQNFVFRFSHCTIYGSIKQVVKGSSMVIKSVTIVGLGLIGGSVAKSIKKHFPDVKIYGYNRSDEPRILAFNDEVIESAKNPTFEEIGKSDVIFLCLPVQVNAKFLSDLKPFLSKNTILTDVGSVKSDITKAVSDQGVLDQFIGGHPMAGSEKSGYSASSDSLLEGAAYILTVDESVDTDKVESFKEFVKGLGSTPMVMDQHSHDRAVAAISHLPHVVSFSYAATIAKMDQSEVLSAITAGSYRDMTRIALSDPTMWKEIFISNREEILKSIDLYQSELNRLRSFIEVSDFDAIHDYIQKAGEYQNENFKRK